MKGTYREDADKEDIFYRVVAAALGLVSFGLFYAWLVNRLERDGYMENQSSWFVAIGTFVTLLIRQVMPPGFFYDLLAFVFSGAPMIINQMITKARVTVGFLNRLKDREWTANRSGQHTAQQ
jgi:uncharacterized membrane protein